MTPFNLISDHLEFLPSSEIVNPKEELAAINNSIGWHHYTPACENYLSDSRTSVYVFTRLFEHVVSYAIVRQDGFDARRGYLPFIAVDELFRRQGIGSQLLRHVVKSVTDLGCSTLSLHCRKPTLAFYEAFAKQDGIECRVKEVHPYSDGGQRYEISYFLDFHEKK
jgi:ribosomal protein S18 acetylase RimI-like enzyme